jgi:exodeoxyribonuclease VII small subunit
MAARPPKPEQPPATDDAALSFEQILERLEGVVETLEQGDTPLEQALGAFERGVSLARLGSRRLDEAERRVELLLSAAEDGVLTRPLDKEQTEDE